MIKHCAVCGCEFETINAKKYCSDSCKAIAKQQQYEAYRPIENERRRAKRQYKTIEAYQEQQKAIAEQKKKEAANRKRKDTRLKNERLKRLKERYSNGDNLAGMILYGTDKLSKNYWQCFKWYEIENNRHSTVNHISIYSETFEEDVIESILENGRIIIL